MNRDLAIALFVSLTLNVGAVVVSECFGNGKPAPAPAVSQATIEVITMPKLEPDEEDAVDEEKPQATQQNFAPPVLNEIPQLVLDTSFVQPIEPPAPGTVAVNKITIALPRSTGARPDGFGEIFEMSKVDQIPEVIVQFPPDYPYQLRSAGVTGEVMVDCIVDSHGDVRNAFALKSSQREFDTAAVRAVNKWKFQPGQRKGRAVNTHVQVPIVFSINRSPFSAGH
jgi:protein TonB